MQTKLEIQNKQDKKFIADHNKRMTIFEEKNKELLDWVDSALEYLFVNERINGLKIKDDEKVKEIKNNFTDFTEFMRIRGWEVSSYFDDVIERDTRNKFIIFFTWDKTRVYKKEYIYIY